jgi:hypothetical protein
LLFAPPTTAHPFLSLSLFLFQYRYIPSNFYTSIAGTARTEDSTMSNNDSDMEDAASDRSDSPEQSESGDHLLPKNNPSNIANDAEISDTCNAKRPTKKPKMAGRTIVPQGK